MFSITIAVGHTSWRLLYKDQEEAEQRRKILEDALVGRTDVVGFISDDFGQIFSGKPAAIIFEDLEKMKMAHVELALHQARVNAAIQKAAQADPGLRANAMMSGPGVLSPMNSFRPS